MSMTSSDQETSIFKCLIERKVLTNKLWRKYFSVLVKKGILSISALIDVDEETITGFEDIPELPKESIKKFRQNLIQKKLKMHDSFSVPLGGNELFNRFQFISQFNIRNYLRDLSFTDQSNQIDLAVRHAEKVRKENPHSFARTKQQATLIALYCQEPPSDRSKSFYSLLNKNLRERNPNILSYQSALYLLDSAIRSLSSLPKDTVTWRGVNYAPDLRKFIVGNTVCFTGICSTSSRKEATINFMEIEPEVGEHKRTLFKLTMINGKSISLWSQVPGECEIISNLCSRWKVLKIDTDHEEDFSPLYPSYACDYYIELQEIEGEVLFPEPAPENCLSGLSLLAEVDYQSIDTSDNFQEEFKDFFTLLHDIDAKNILRNVLMGYWNEDSQQFFDYVDRSKVKDTVVNFFQGLASLSDRLVERSVETKNALRLCEHNKIYSWVELQGAGARKRTLEALQDLGFSSSDASKIYQETEEDHKLHELYEKLNLSGDFDNPNLESEFHSERQLMHYVMREGVTISLYRIAQSLTDGLQVALRSDITATILRIPGRFGFVLQRADVYIASAMVMVQLSSYAFRLWYGDITSRQMIKMSVAGFITAGAGLIGAIVGTIICPIAGITAVIAGLISGAIFGAASHAVSRWLLNKLFPDGEEEEINVARKIYYQALASLNCLPSSTMPEIRKRYHHLCLENHTDKHPTNPEEAIERFYAIVAAYAIVQAYYEVLENACKALNLDISTLTLDTVKEWKKINQDMLSTANKKPDEKTLQIRRSYRIVCRHLAFSDQVKFRWIRRFLNRDKFKTLRKKKPSKPLPINYCNEPRTI